MARTKISEFSATPGNNTDIDGINLAEGCAPSGINDAIRELMSQLKDFQAGTAGDSFNGPVGTTTSAAGAFTTLSASSSVTLSGGTANGVPYLNGSKVLTTGSALTFDGTNLATTGGVFLNNAQYFYSKTSGGTNIRMLGINSGNTAYIGPIDSGPGDSILNASSSSANIQFYASGSEQMRLTSTGLGIGTSSPATKLHVESSSATTNTKVVSALSGSLFYSGFEVARTTVTAGALMRSARNSSIGGVGWEWLTTADNNAEISGSYTSRMILDNAGNLGLGVTPSAWGSSFKALQVSPRAAIWGDTTQSILSHNMYTDGTDRYIANGFATLFTQQNGAYKWFTAPSGTAGNAISFTQAMTLDASGNLGVGTTNPGCRLDARGTSLISSFDNASGVYSRWKHNGTNVGIIGTANQVVSGGSTSGFAIGTELAGELVFATNNTERARILPGGGLLVGCTSTPNASVPGFGINVSDGFGDLSIVCAAPNTSGDRAIAFYNPNGMVGSITTGGNSTSFNTSSDYRLKENIQPMTGALAKVKALKPCTYNWKADGSEGEGFIAHELAEVVPQCVTGEKDAVDAEGKPVYQGIDTSFLVATLAAAIQEQQAMIQQLQAEVAALKGN